MAPRVPDGGFYERRERPVVRRGGIIGGGDPKTTDFAEESYPEAAVGDTSHIDVIGKHGTMITATASGGWLQFSPAISEPGVPLGARARMTWLGTRVTIIVATWRKAGTERVK